MGRDRTTTTTQQTTTPQATPEETQLNQLEIERQKATNPGVIGTQQKGLDLIQQLLSGGTLPGYLNKLPQGIDDAAQTDIANKAISDIQPFFNGAGILDSGVNAAVSGRVAGDVRRASYETNLNNLFNLLNLAVGGQAQIQAPILAGNEALGNRLAGLRSTTSTGSSTQSAMNPFLRSFQTSLGSTLGSPFIGSGTGQFGFGGRAN